MRLLLLLLGLTFQPDHQGHLQLQLPTGLGDSVGDDGAVDNPAKNVHQDGLHLQRRETGLKPGGKQAAGVCVAPLETFRHREE